MATGAQSEDVDGTVKKELKLLQQLSILNKALSDTDVIEKLLHELMDVVTRERPLTDLINSKRTVEQQPFTPCDLHQLYSAVASLCSLPPTGGDWLSSLSSSCCHIDASIIDVIERCVRVRHADITRHHTALTHGVSATPTLTDFDWQLRYCISSDSLSALHQPLLTLSLTLQSPGGGAAAGQSVAALEMDTEELGAFIRSLEEINEALTKLQT